MLGMEAQRARTQIRAIREQRLECLANAPVQPKDKHNLQGRYSERLFDLEDRDALTLLATERPIFVTTHTRCMLKRARNFSELRQTSIDVHKNHAV